MAIILFFCSESFGVYENAAVSFTASPVTGTKIQWSRKGQTGAYLCWQGGRPGKTKKKAIQSQLVYRYILAANATSTATIPKSFRASE